MRSGTYDDTLQKTTAKVLLYHRKLWFQAHPLSTIESCILGHTMTARSGLFFYVRLFKTQHTTTVGLPSSLRRILLLASHKGSRAYDIPR